MTTINWIKNGTILWSKRPLLLFVLFLQSGLIDAQGMADDTCDRLRNKTTSSVTVRQGEELVLTCLSDATQNEPQLTWFKNGIALHDDDEVLVHGARFSLDSDRDKNGNCSATSLMIADVREADGGIYVCRRGVSEKENGTICVTVEVFSQTIQGPKCFTNLIDDDTVLLTCIAEQGACPVGRVGSLRWNGLDSLPIEIQQDQSSNGSHLINSQVITTQQALGSDVNCILSCEGNSDKSDCSSTTLLSTCEVDIFTASPKSQTIRPGENATFTCQVLWDGYNVAWLISDEYITLHNNINVTPSDNDKTSTLMLTMFPEGTFNLVCSLRKNSGILILKPVTLTVTSDLDIGMTIPATILYTTQRSAAVYVPLFEDDVIVTRKFSLTYVVIIVVVAIGILILLLVVGGCVVCRRPKRDMKKQPTPSQGIDHIYETRI